MTQAFIEPQSIYTIFLSSTILHIYTINPATPPARSIMSPHTIRWGILGTFTLHGLTSQRFYCIILEAMLI